jgi:hypothetical protein
LNTAERRPGHARRRRPSTVRWLFLVAALAVVFAIGVAIGQALHDNPKPGPARTSVRTLKPLPLAPAPQTVTVTATTSP